MFGSSIIYDLNSKDSDCLIFMNLDSPNKPTNMLETSISGTPCSIDTDRDNNLVSYKDNIIKLNTNMINGATVILNCKNGYKYVDSSKKNNILQ